MSALETEEETSKTEIKLTVPEYDKKQWVFKKNSNGVEFSIGDESKGKVTKIEITSDQRLMVVHVSRNTFSTNLSKSPDVFENAVSDLSVMCGKLVEERKRRLGARMLAAVNGRCNFDFYLPLMVRERPENCEEITRDRLLKMLKRENEIRLSKEALDALEMEARDFEENEEIGCRTLCNKVHIPQSIVECQEKLVKEFGYRTNEQMNYALQMLRSARALFPDDIEIKNATYYLKFNRAHRGELKVGDIYKDISLMTCGKEEKKLSEIINEKKATVIIGGSVT